MNLIAKFKKGDDDDDDDRDFHPSGGDEEDFLSDLGDLDQIEADAAERDAAGPEEHDAYDDGDDFGGPDDDGELDVLDEYDSEDIDDFADLDEISTDSGGETVGDEAPDVPEFDLGDFDDEDEVDFDEDEDEDEAAQKAKLKKLLIMAGGGVGLAMVLGGLAWWLIGSDGGGDDVAAGQTPEVVRGEIDLGDLTAPRPEPTPAPTPAPAPRPAPTQHSPSPSPAPESPRPSDEREIDPSSPLGQLRAHGLDVQMEPGEGLVIPSATVASYENVPSWPASGPLQAAPMQGLTEQGEHGPLPVIAEDGLTPYDAYARPEPTEESGDPKIAVIVTGLGMSRASTQAALNSMPPEVAFALSVYGRGLDFWGRRAREKGHELLLEMPAESTDFPFSDPGPNALQSLATPEDNIAQLEWILSRTTGYFGVMSIYGSKFLSVEEQVDNMMREIKKRGLMYVDGGAQDSLGTRSAYKLKTNWAAVELTLDEQPGRAAFDAKLAEFEDLAKRRALSIARVSASPMVLELLSVWLRSLNEKGLKLVPVSSLANKQLIR